jgi:hypothetical protein
MHRIPLTSKRLMNTATTYKVYCIARLSRPSLAHARLCLRFARTIATAMLLLRTSMCSALRASLRLFNFAPGEIVAPARRTVARVLSDHPSRRCALRAPLGHRPSLSLLGRSAGWKSTGLPSVSASPLVQYAGLPPACRHGCDRFAWYRIRRWISWRSREIMGAGFSLLR